MRQARRLTGSQQQSPAAGASLSVHSLEAVGTSRGGGACLRPHDAPVAIIVKKWGADAPSQRGQRAAHELQRSAASGSGARRRRTMLRRSLVAGCHAGAETVTRCLSLHRDTRVTPSLFPHTDHMVSNSAQEGRCSPCFVLSESAFFYWYAQADRRNCVKSMAQ